MVYNVSDFINTHTSSVRLLAGQGGLVRPISEVGFLDYELVPGLKARYQRTNFYEGQLVLATFLYARDNPYLITDAVRYLVSVGASGLVIKNVFHLEIPDAALRLANARNLPVLLVTSEDFFFDEIILEVALRVRELASAAFAQREITALLGNPDDSATVVASARRLNPSFGDELAALYAPLADGTDETAASSQAESLASVHDLACCFDGGLLLVTSAETLRQTAVDETARRLSELMAPYEPLSLGVSDVHEGTSSLAQAILEAVHAARIAQIRQTKLAHYGDLGMLRAILPHAASPHLASYAQHILGPIRDFDVEHNAHLEQTLTAYFDHDRSIDKAAETLSTHPNTVRYRLGQVAGVTGLDWRVPVHMEQLSFAHAISVTQEVAWR